MLDMALILNPPEKQYPYLVITGPHAATYGKNGIPPQQEIEELEKVLDATDNFLTGVTAKVLAGTVTYDGRRNNYYYVKDTMNVRAALMRMYNRNFKGYKYSIIIRPDPQWLAYHTFLYPDDTTQNWMDNNHNITTLLQHGDTLERKHTITFAACFTSDTARGAFAAYVKDHGYTVDKTPQVKVGEAHDCLLFSIYEAIVPDNINMATMRLRKEIKRRGGVYNGWNAR